MQAIPSTTPLSRTAFCTSSVMSLTVSPPVVRRRVSCWNTFIVVAILRESLPDARGELPNPQWILRSGGDVILPVERVERARRRVRRPHEVVVDTTDDRAEAERCPDGN